MISDYARTIKEIEIEEELKWLEKEQEHVQGTIDSMAQGKQQEFQSIRERNSNPMSKPRTPR